nr:MAG TPA: intron associated endonuclease [Bacteriophage sp.]
MKFGKIYLITNEVNSKVYVGQTIQTLNKRFNGHCCYSKSDRSINMYIKRAIHKYGRDKFHIQLIEECPINILNEREKYWINFYDSYNTGYNLTLGGQDSNYFNINKLENVIDIKKFEQYILEFKPLVSEVANHFGISKCSVYNLINRINNPNLILNSYNPRKGRTIEDIDKEELINLYKEGWSILDLVKKYHIRKDKISKFIKESGIKIKRGIKGYKHRI